MVVVLVDLECCVSGIMIIYGGFLSGFGMMFVNGILIVL
jgi:hypothetical protein